MCLGQAEPLDMLMYYDARPCGMNGMFKTDIVCERLKGYYPFYMFGQLYHLGRSAAVAVEDENNYAVAATGDSEAAVMLTRYNDDDSTPADTVSVDLCGFGADSGTEIEIFILDEERDLEPTFKATYYGDRFKIDLPTDNLVSYLIKLKKT